MTSPEWLQFLVSYTVQSSLVIGVAFGLDRWSSRTPTAQARVWTACFVSLLLLLAAGLLLPRLHLLHPWKDVPPPQLLLAAEVEVALGRGMLGVWLLGVGVMAARSLIDFVRVQRFIAGCPPCGPALTERLRALVAEKAFTVGGRAVELRIGPEDLGPFCYQFHRPLVFLPQSLMEGDQTDLSHVLDHELTHLRTEHPLQLCLQKMVQAVLWFHPLVWISAERAGLVREFVCDDAATQCGASTASYLRTLLHVVEQRSGSRGGLMTIGRSVGEVRLRAQRLALMGHAPTRPVAMSPSCAVALAAVAVSQLWLPTNPLATSRTLWSGWPTWSAATLHALDVPVRDFEPFDDRTQLHELQNQPN